MRITNPKASFDYNLLEKLEAGIVLTGAEVKSVKKGHISLKESFVKIIGQEAWLVNAHINPYFHAGQQGYDPRRRRKLLLHKKELLRLSQQVKEKGLTLVPVACYNKGPRVKLEIALAKGKREYQKKEAKKRKDIEREVERELRGKDSNRVIK